VDQSTVNVIVLTTGIVGLIALALGLFINHWGKYYLRKGRKLSQEKNAFEWQSNLIHGSILVAVSDIAIVLGAILGAICFFVSWL
jgi:Co/Zn/Cd efflux system component